MVFWYSKLLQSPPRAILRSLNTFLYSRGNSDSLCPRRAVITSWSQLQIVTQTEPLYPSRVFNNTWCLELKADDEPSCFIISILLFSLNILAQVSLLFTIPSIESMASSVEEAATTILVTCKQTRFDVKNPVYQEVCLVPKFICGTLLMEIAWHWRPEYHRDLRKRENRRDKSKRESASWRTWDLGKCKSETKSWCPLCAYWS